MTETEDLRSMMAGEFAARGMSKEGAERLAEFIEAVCEIQITSALASQLRPLRACMWGEAMWRELAGDDEESIAAAASRLHTTKRELNRARARIRAMLGNHVPPADTVEPR